MMDYLRTKFFPTTHTEEMQLKRCLIRVMRSAKQIDICYVRDVTVFGKHYTEEAHIEWSAKSNEWHVELAQVFGIKRTRVETPYLGIEMARRHLEMPVAMSSQEMDFLNKQLSH